MFFLHFTSGKKIYDGGKKKILGILVKMPGILLMEISEIMLKLLTGRQAITKI